MFNFKTILLILLAGASLIASLIIHNHANEALRARAEISLQQSQQLANLQSEQRHLSNQLTHVSAGSRATHSAEIAKLRAEAEALQRRTNELAKESQSHRTLKSKQSVSKQDDHPPEYWKQFNQLAGNKSVEALYVARAITEYADDHRNQFPSSLDQVAPYLAKNNLTLSGTNHFEIIFQGSLDQLDGIPWTSVAVVRETEPWPSPDGTPTRAYGMLGGMGQIISTDDNFQSWESGHVIPPASSSTH